MGVAVPTNRVCADACLGANVSLGSSSTPHSFPHDRGARGPPAPAGLLPATWEVVGEGGGRVHSHFPTSSSSKTNKPKGKQRWKQEINSRPKLEGVEKERACGNRFTRWFPARFQPAVWAHHDERRPQDASLWDSRDADLAPEGMATLRNPPSPVTPLLLLLSSLWTL